MTGCFLQFTDGLVTLTVFPVTFIPRIGIPYTPRPVIRFPDEQFRILSALIQKMATQLQCVFITGHPVQLHESKFDLRMTRHSGIALHDEVVINMLHVPDHDIEKSAFAGRLKVGTGSLDHVSCHIEFMCLVKICPTFLTVLYREISIEISVPILRPGNDADDFVQFIFKSRIRCIHQRI